jgi:hypothetical protein
VAKSSAISNPVRNLNRNSRNAAGALATGGRAGFLSSFA